MTLAVQPLGTQNIDSAGSTMPPAQLVEEFSSVIKGLQSKIGAPGIAGTIDSQVTAMIGNFDKDGTPDNKLNAKELAAALGITEGQALDFIDTFNKTGDTDRALDAEELFAAYETVAEATETTPSETETPPASKGGGGGGGSTEGSSGAGGGGGMAALLPQLLKILDENGDGKISEDEAKGFIEKYAGADGKLSKEELKEGLKAEAAEKGVALPEMSDEDLSTLFSQMAGADEGMDAAELMNALNASAESET